jgi:RNA polymerase sigma factor (TIGR02999 family)
MSMNAQVRPESGHSALARPPTVGAIAPVNVEHDITGLLLAWSSGDEDALELLFPRVYDELRHIAHRHLAREREGHTLSTTALVNEAYLKLVDQTRAQWTDRAHFFAVSARVMRRILVDYARRHQAQKRGGAIAPVTLDDESFINATLVADQRADMLIALDEALTRLAELDERLSRVVECRFFGGLTEEETATALSVTARTVRRDWIKAKGWLHQALRE